MKNLSRKYGVGSAVVSLAALAAFAVACSSGASGGSASGAPFTGSYTGTISVHLNSSSTTVTQTWTLTQSGDTVSLNWDSCPGLTATVNGSVATVNAMTCPADGTSTTAYTGGTLSLAGDSLIVDLADTVTSSGVAYSGDVTGTLSLDGASSGSSSGTSPSNSGSSSGSKSNPCGDGCHGCSYCSSTGCVACPTGDEGVCTC